MTDLLTAFRHALGADGIICLIVTIAGMTIAFLTTPIARRLALHHGATDNPGARRVHKRITPRMGGLAVLAAILGATILGMQQWSGTGIERLEALAVVVPILLIGAMVCLFGALDDLTPISPLGKIAGLSTAGLLLALCGVSIEVVTLPWVGRIELGAMALPATIFWVLACTNAVNLIDGVDGSGPGVVTISAFALMLLSLGLGDFTTGLLFAATCGGACGFLIHNRQPASIFLGDSGSLLLGFMLAAASAAGCTKSATALTLVGALLALAVPFLDAIQSFVRRFHKSLRSETKGVIPALRATAVADLGHIHHRLLRRGMSHREVALTVCLVTMVTGFSALLLLPTGQVHGSTIAAALVTGAFVLARVGWVRKPPMEAPTSTPSVVAEPVPESIQLVDDPPGPQGMGRPRRRDPRTTSPIAET
jgi:UDP-GlcNAc:undecaprenyl-phosphate GlcNAc-1-phosphate transferase